MKPLTAFTWGYYGWGPRARDFVNAVDAVERRRGKRPPIFVDIRFSRGARAVGFRESAFEKSIGKGRYFWLRKLGNAQIGSGGKGIRIADRSGVEELLQLVTDANLQSRRVIFFCACERPCNCHRAVVARLLVKAAARKGIPLTVVEWPGEAPKVVTLTVPDKIVRYVLHNGSRIPIDKVRGKSLQQFIALPWCSRVTLNSGEVSIAVVSGPAQLAGGWYLPVIGPDISKLTDNVDGLKDLAVRLRKSLGYRPCRE
jgi:hypothetical protein